MRREDEKGEKKDTDMGAESAGPTAACCSGANRAASSITAAAGAVASATPTGVAKMDLEDLTQRENKKQRNQPLDQQYSVKRGRGVNDPVGATKRIKLQKVGCEVCAPEGRWAGVEGSPEEKRGRGSTRDGQDLKVLVPVFPGCDATSRVHDGFGLPEA